MICKSIIGFGGFTLTASLRLMISDKVETAADIVIIKGGFRYYILLFSFLWIDYDCKIILDKTKRKKRIVSKGVREVLC